MFRCFKLICLFVLQNMCKMWILYLLRLVGKTFWCTWGIRDNQRTIMNWSHSREEMLLWIAIFVSIRFLYRGFSLILFQHWIAKHHLTLCVNATRFKSKMSLFFTLTPSVCIIRQCRRKTYTILYDIVLKMYTIHYDSILKT